MNIYCDKRNTSIKPYLLQPALCKLENFLELTTDISSYFMRKSLSTQKFLNTDNEKNKLKKRKKKIYFNGQGTASICYAHI